MEELGHPMSLEPFLPFAENATGECRALKWFSNFKDDHFDVNDCPRSGTPFDFNKDV